MMSMFYLMFCCWILHFLSQTTLGIFDKMGFLSTIASYDTGYCALLIPASLLIPQFGVAIILQLNKMEYSWILIYAVYILLKITFWILRGLWESTALKILDHLKYAHLMFPIFFIEELIDIILLIKLKFSYEIIGALILFLINHIIRDGDIGYQLIYKNWTITCMTKIYFSFYYRKYYLKKRRKNGSFAIGIASS